MIVSDIQADVVGGRQEMASRLFRHLNKSGFEYCVLGAAGGGGDIDIAVDGADGQTMIQAMREFCRANGLRLVQFVHHKCGWRFDISWRDERGRLQFLHPDLCRNYVRNGRIFLTSGDLVSGRLRDLEDTTGAVAAPASEFIYYLVKKIDKLDLNSRHGDHLSAVWREDPAGSMRGIDRFWSGDGAALLTHAAQQCDWQAVSLALPRLRKLLHDRLPRPSPVALLHEALRRVGRFVRPTGLHVVFLGADGSGKSTIIEKTAAALAPAFRGNKILHLRPAIGVKSGGGGPVTDPHGAPPRGPFTSIAKIGYFVIDYAAGWFLTVRPRLVRTNFVIFDRYYHDLLVDPRRYRYGGPMWLARWAGLVVPKPDLWILLDAPAEVLHARKQEVPIEEARRQRQAYLELMARLDDAVVVDASMPLETVAAAVNDAILSRLARRTDKRLGR